MDPQDPKTEQENLNRVLRSSLAKIPPVPSHGSRPRSIRETEPWKASQRGISRLWNNYKTVLATSFKAMSRDEQEQLITNFCMIVTIGVTGLALLLFYQFIPRLVRVFAVPVAGFAAWWTGTRIVAKVMIMRLESILNKEESDTGE
jgi:hypothetical protein